ncbi:hypothetical protein BCV69DRAFT_15370 [Microstroma glucosiphilum]|uniref:Uncharacterized protein n=1 Tax=Pseudomicrostroma glucosiphilum TaxID=1684307 RepID=A0A316UJ45_9BASI|nr:hypothetical protein BCV69DRAFT_15370 [Pseudomicrostroma glucosiphilum]PWN23963.1 hypothetical protein BCV69DRAFT_15370 [Pseudomicrostroma glucosiphilum]
MRPLRQTQAVNMCRLRANAGSSRTRRAEGHFPSVQARSRLFSSGPGTRAALRLFAEPKGRGDRQTDRKRRQSISAPEASKWGRLRTRDQCKEDGSQAGRQADRQADKRSDAPLFSFSLLDTERLTNGVHPMPSDGSVGLADP